MDGKTRGTLTEEDTIVTFYFAYNSKVIVKYIDMDSGNEIAEADTIEGYEGKEYKVTKKAIVPYLYVSCDGLPEGYLGQRRRH